MAQSVPINYGTTAALCPGDQIHARGCRRQGIAPILVNADLGILVHLPITNRYPHISSPRLVDHDQKGTNFDTMSQQQFYPLIL